MFKTILNISGYVENMLKISRHAEIYNMCRKLCWNSMLKISACVKNCNACWKPCQNFKVCWKCLYEPCWKPYWKPCWSTKKTLSHFTACVEIEQQISFFSFGFARVSECETYALHKYVFYLLVWIFQESLDCNIQCRLYHCHLNIVNPQRFIWQIIRQFKLWWFPLKLNYGLQSFSA